MRRRSISSRTLKPVFFLTLAFGVLCNSRITPCDAAIIASLSEARAISGEKFESDLVMSGTSDAIGDTIEFIELDVILSTVKSEPLSDFSKVRFDASPRFAPWQGDQQFGSPPGFESRVSLIALPTDGPLPFPITDTNPFRVGTITFDYNGMGLQGGDSITLNIFGRDDGSATRTTSVAIRPAGSSETTFVNPDFSSPAGSERSTFTVPTAIPEPGLSAFLSFAFATVFVGRRSRRQVSVR